jgi:uncharacterized caspase-like protein
MNTPMLPRGGAVYPLKVLRKTVLGALVAAMLAQPLHARVALVIGNSSYPQSPLDNPVNDARAIALALQAAGFEVDLLLDQRRDAMQASIQRFGAKLAAKKQPSVFYFAGHALQLAWRNYLLPTDISIRRAEDVPAQAVDLNELLAQLGKASASTGGSSNIVILDACRDNPFGQSANAARGLTQLDAPNGTLLAYATAPGNVAQDAGSGKNGLYTEHLLKEMQTEGAKIEDVLKRVRLSVRLVSKGQQVPWESTSLEEDFYFRPPRESAKLSQEDAEKAFEEELTAWTTARGTGQISVLEDFMRRYPSGKFSELAQYRLDALLAAQKKAQDARRTAQEAQAARLKAEAEVVALRQREQQIALALTGANADAQRAARVEREALAARQAQAERAAASAREQMARAASAPVAADARAAEAQPGSIEGILAAALQSVQAESASVDEFPPARPGEIRRGWRPGDLLVYRETPQSGAFRFESTVRQRAFTVTNAKVEMRGGLALDHFSYPSRTASFDSSTDAQMLLADYQVGKKWSTRFKRAYGRNEAWMEAQGQVLARETLDTPAGRFDAYKVSIKAELAGGQGWKFDETWWIDTVSLKPVAYERRETESGGFVRDHRKGVLIAFENDGRTDRD